MAPAAADVATGLTHDLGFVVSCIRSSVFPALESLRWCPWERWGRDQQEPKPGNPRQNGPMSADLLDQVGVLIV